MMGIMQKTILIVLLLIMMSFGPLFLVYGGTNPASCRGGDHSLCKNMNIQVKEGCISLDIKNQPLDCVLNQVGRQTGIHIRIWEESRKPVSLRLTHVPLADFFTRLGADNALVYQYDTKKNEFKLIAANIAKSHISAPVTKSETKSTLGSQIIPENKVNPPNVVLENQGEERVKPGELIVRFKEDVSKDRMNRLHQFLGSKIIEQIDSLNLHRVGLDPQLSIKTAMEMYLATDIVASAQGNGLRRSHGTLPNDPEFILQWGLTAIKAPDAWEITRGSEEVVIAVIDTGVDYRHPDLQENIWVNPAEAGGLAGVDDDQNGKVDDLSGWDFAAATGADDEYGDNQPLDVAGHGTHVAGIIGGVTDNLIGIAGVCPRVKLMVLKVQGDQNDYMEIFDIIQAIEYAREQGADIINCSFGGPEFDKEEYAALERFQNANNGLMICSAGNETENTDITPLYPACYDLPGIISVAGSAEIDPNEYELAGFSNYGSASVDVMAPGEGIVSTMLGDTYGSMSGTSMAAGFVSGAAGLLRARFPKESFSQLKEILLNTVDVIDLIEGRDILTKGQINIFKALAPLVGDVNKDYNQTIEDSIIGLKIFSGRPSTISQDVPHWDGNNDHQLGFPEIIHVLQQRSR
jgi:subtilisin family serine protease